MLLNIDYSKSYLFRYNLNALFAVHKLFSNIKTLLSYVIELRVGFEPTTCSLQVSCTTTVLREQISTPNIQINSLSDIDANNKYFIDQINSLFNKKNN